MSSFSKIPLWRCSLNVFVIVFVFVFVFLVTLDKYLKGHNFQRSLFEGKCLCICLCVCLCHCLCLCFRGQKYQDRPLKLFSKCICHHHCFCLCHCICLCLGQVISHKHSDQMSQMSWVTLLCSQWNVWEDTFLDTSVYYTLLNRVSLYLLLIKAWVKNSDSIINWYSNNKIYTTRNTSFCREIRWLPAQANTQLLKYDLPTCPYMPIYGLTLRIGRGPAGNGQILVFVSLFCSAY